MDELVRAYPQHDMYTPLLHRWLIRGVTKGVGGDLLIGHNEENKATLDKDDER